MRIQVVAALLAISGCSGPPAPPGAGALAPALRVTPYGIGPVRAGMSLAEASAALGARLTLPGGADESACAYPTWPGGPDGVSLMVENGHIVRVDVRSGSTATEDGARIGDPAERVWQLYAGRVAASPHKYTDGQYLTVTPDAPDDRVFRLVFETEAGRVTRYRSGRLPQVQYVEGCS